MREPRRGLVVYQLLLILLVVVLLIWLIVTLVNRNGATPSITPVDSAVVDTAPFPVPDPDTAVRTDSALPTVPDTTAGADSTIP